MNYCDTIPIETGMRVKKPTMRGLLIPVHDLLEYMARAMSEHEVLADLPDIAHEDIQACLAFTADRECKLTSIPLPKIPFRPESVLSTGTNGVSVRDDDAESAYLPPMNPQPGRFIDNKER